MVRNLFLLRHGHAEHGFQIPDFDRSLSSTGVNQLTTLGMSLKKVGFYPNKIFCSPAKRTLQTAAIITEQLDYNLPVEYTADIYEASVRTLLDIVTHVDDRHERILIIAHNPGISFLFDYLTADSFGDLSPGQLAQVVFENQRWQEVTKGSGTNQPM